MKELHEAKAELEHARNSLALVETRAHLARMERKIDDAMHVHAAMTHDRDALRDIRLTLTRDVEAMKARMRGHIASLRGDFDDYRELAHILADRYVVALGHLLREWRYKGPKGRERTPLGEFLRGTGAIDALGNEVPGWQQQLQSLIEQLKATEHVKEATNDGDDKAVPPEPAATGASTGDARDAGAQGGDQAGGAHVEG